MSLSDVEDSEVDLPPNYIFDDVAQAVSDVAYEQGAGGSICQVLKCNVAKDVLSSIYMHSRRTTPPTEHRMLFVATNRNKCK